MVTMKDVAATAGVSIATVSHVINKTLYVSPEMTSRVEIAMKELDYVPNALARGLVTRKSGIVALLVDDIKNPYFAEILQSAEIYARKFNYHVFLFNFENSLREQEHCVDSLRSKWVDGMIVISPIDDKLMSQLLRINIAMVLYGREYSDKKVRSIVIDTFQGAVQITSYLTNLGHRRIAFISGPLSMRTHYQRMKGYLSVLQKHKIPKDDSLIFEENCHFTGGYSAARKIIKVDSKKRPTAIFCANDLMAVGALRAIVENNLRVPQDISLTGFDDIELSSFVNPPLTTSSIPKNILGETSMQLLFKLIDGKHPKRVTKISTSLVIRESASQVS